MRNTGAIEAIQVGQGLYGIIGASHRRNHRIFDPQGGAQRAVHAIATQYAHSDPAIVKDKVIDSHIAANNTASSHPSLQEETFLTLFVILITLYEGFLEVSRKIHQRKPQYSCHSEKPMTLFKTIALEPREAC
jgi:hypothetical protein